jgi:serine/threonine protein kinase
MTSTNTVRGTPSYMSPEQWRRGSVTHKADVYAYGLLVLELFTGRELTWTGLPAEFEDVKGREQAKRSWCVQPPHKRPRISLFCAKRGYPLVAHTVASRLFAFFSSCLSLIFISFTRAQGIIALCAPAVMGVTSSLLH